MLLQIEWTNIEERPPELGMEVMFIWKERVWTGTPYKFEDSTYWSVIFGGMPLVVTSEVTHWALLPWFPHDSKATGVLLNENRHGSR